MTDEDRYTRITLRIPKGLVPPLKEAADARSHSMNAEIVQRLEASFPRSTLLTDAFERDMADAQPKDREERGLLLAYRALSLKEREAMLAMLDAFIDKAVPRRGGA